MRRVPAVLLILALAGAASAKSPSSDERFFGLFLPIMIALGVLIVVGVVVANVVARRRFLRTLPPFASAAGYGPGSGVTPTAAPRTTSRTTTTRSADGSVTVTVIEETFTTTSSFGGNLNGVVDPSIRAGGTLNEEGFPNDLGEEILKEVREAFRRIDPPHNGS